jgi:hypothetical protein
MKTSKSSSPLYEGIGMPVATVLRYAYVPEVTGVRLSTSRAASRIASWIRPLNVLLYVSEIHLLSVRMRLGFGSQPDISSWLQSYPAGVAERPRGGLSPSLSISGLSSGSESLPGSPPAGGLLPLPPPPPPLSSLPPGSSLRGCPLDVGPGVGKGERLGPLLLGGVGVGGECLLSFSSSGLLSLSRGGVGFGVDRLLLVVLYIHLKNTTTNKAKC